MRKRFLSTVLVLIMLLSLAPMSALADDTFRSGDFTFVIETGVACVKKYNGSSSSVSVPSKVDYDGVTYKVRNIHQDAFKNCTTIQKLVLPETVNRIGKQAIHSIMMICCIHQELSYLRPIPLRRNEWKKKTGIR